VQLKYETLYLLNDPLATKPIRLKECRNNKLDLEWGETVGLLKGSFSPPEPIKLCPARGGKFTDFMWSTLLHVIVVSERVVDLLTSNNLTGWKTYPVTVYDKQEQVVGGYYGLAITGKVGRPDFRRSEIIEKPPITPKGVPYKVFKGIHFENDFTDDSDISLIETTTYRVVTQKVVQAFRRAKIYNVELVPLKEAEMDVSVWEAKGLWPLKNEITT